MNNRKRDVIHEHWRRVIQYEARDLDRLQMASARIAADRDVRADSSLDGLLQSDIQKRRHELEQVQQGDRLPSASPALSADGPARPAACSQEMSPAEIHEAFKAQTELVAASLEARDEAQTHKVIAHMRELQKCGPQVIPIAELAQYERRVSELRSHIKNLEAEIGGLKEQVILAARKGTPQDLARSMGRLAAIHAAHPRLLEEAEVEALRRHVARATDEGHQDRRVMRELLNRERSIAAEIKKLSASVREFHRVSCALPETSDIFQRAEGEYRRAIERVDACDGEWFSAIVLELADLLAEWTLPPVEAEGQIDRFLDGIGAGLKSIRAQIHEIEGRRGAGDDDAIGS